MSSFITKRATDRDPCAWRYMLSAMSSISPLSFNFSLLNSGPEDDDGSQCTGRQLTKEQKRAEGRRRALEIAKAKQRAISNDTDPPRKGKRATRKSARHGARNQNRHKNFAKWLLEKFPHIVDMPTSMHICDVAGGKGELSARLSMCHSLKVVMIDPREANIPSVYLNDVVPKLPKKWQQSVLSRLDESPNFVEEEAGKRFEQLVMPFVSPTPAFSNPSASDKFEDPLLDNAIKNASLLVGLHADGATEAIVDAALAYKKPFVVVPCCVFPSLFRHRFVTVKVDGEIEKRVHVRTHAHFCQYLQEKDSSFKREELPFDGRNVAIWWDGR